MGSSGGSIRADVLVHLLLRHSRRVLSFGSRGRSIRPGRFFVTAENALPPAATGRRRFGIFFRSFADLVADRLIFRGIRSGFGLFFSHSVTGFSRAGGDHIVTGSLSRIDTGLVLPQTIGYKSPNLTDTHPLIIILVE